MKYNAKVRTISDGEAIKIKNVEEKIISDGEGKIYNINDSLANEDGTG